MMKKITCCIFLFLLCTSLVLSVGEIELTLGKSPVYIEPANGTEILFSDNPLPFGSTSPVNPNKLDPYDPVDNVSIQIVMNEVDELGVNVISQANPISYYSNNTPKFLWHEKTIKMYIDDREKYFWPVIHPSTSRCFIGDIDTETHQIITTTTQLNNAVLCIPNSVQGIEEYKNWHNQYLDLYYSQEHPGAIDKLLFIQIGNEEDGDFIKPGGENYPTNPNYHYYQAYARLIEELYPIIKSRTNASVVIGTLGTKSVKVDGLYRPMLQYLYNGGNRRCGGTGCFDYFDYHLYGTLDTYDNREIDQYGVLMQKNITLFKELLAEEGFSDKKIVIQQSGTYSGQDPTIPNYAGEYQTEKDQAEFIFKRYIYTNANGAYQIQHSYVADGMCWKGSIHNDFTMMGLVYDGIPNNLYRPLCDTETEDYTIYNCDEQLPCPDPGFGVRKQSFYTLKLLMEKLSGSDYNNVETVYKNNSVFIFRYPKGNTSVYVAWWDWWQDCDKENITACINLCKSLYMNDYTQIDGCVNNCDASCISENQPTIRLKLSDINGQAKVTEAIPNTFVGAQINPENYFNFFNTLMLDVTEPSCYDSDGGEVLNIFGGTSGYLNNLGYNNDDYCINENNIVEYFCNGEYSESSQQSCGTDNVEYYCLGSQVYSNSTDYSCKLGECKSELLVQFQENCNDLDNHGTNYCLNGSVYRDYEDYSCYEGGCNLTLNKELIEFCTAGCSEGECNSDIDSDGNRDEVDSCYNPGAPVGLSGYWTMKEGAGTSTADSFGKNDELLKGASWTSGKIDNALNFNGNQYATTKNFINQNSTYTISAWIYPTLVNGVRKDILSSKASGSNSFIDFRIRNNDKPACFAKYNGVEISASALSTIQANQWYFITCTFDSSRKVSLYINGVYQTISKASIVGIPTVNNLTLGINDYLRNSYGYSGKIDEVALWNRVLTSQEIQDYYSKGINGEGYCEEPSEICGDTICEGTETCSTCENDCGECIYCGDAICNDNETCSTCENDCGGCIPNSCSDSDGGNFINLLGITYGIFENQNYSYEDYCFDSSNIFEYFCNGDLKISLQQSCGTDIYNSSYCLNNSVYKDLTDYFCNSGKCDNQIVSQLQEACDSHDFYESDYCLDGSIYRDFKDYFCSAGNCEFSLVPEFVKNCVAGCTDGICNSYCGDLNCDFYENCSICEDDCGVCPYCGDGSCNGEESCSTCESDCGECPPQVCGDGLCNGDENCLSCNSDCGACTEDICIDSDGGDVPAIYGETNSYRLDFNFTYHYADSCLTTTYLLERSCSNNLATFRWVNCVTEGYTNCSNAVCY